MKVADYHHRFGAFVIDWHYRTVPLALWGFTVLFLAFPAWWAGVRQGPLTLGELWQIVSSVLRRDAIAASGWACFAAYLLYHPVVELAMHGDSPGKRTMGIRVVSLDGSRPAARQVLLRNLWRAIEFLPVGYLWGLLAILRSEDNARMGDRFAGTRVVSP